MINYCPNNQVRFLNDTHMEELDSVQKFIEMQGWLLLTFAHMFTQSIKLF